MQPHTLTYLLFFGYSIDFPEEEYIPCEFFVYDGCHRRMTDVHHIDIKGMGGRPGKEYDISELMGTCRVHHNKIHKENIPKELLLMIHERYLTHWSKNKFNVYEGTNQ